MKRALLLFSSIILLFAARPAQSQWSVEVGGGYVAQQDTFIAPCGCRFTEGKGYAMEVALLYDLYSAYGFTLGARVGADYSVFRSAHYYGIVRDSGYFKLLYGSAAPFLRYDVPAIGLFIQAAPTVGYLLSSYLYQRWHRGDGTIWGNGSVDTLQEDGPLQDPTKIRLSARLSAGTSFELLDQQFLPMLTADIPITENESANRSGKVTSEWSLMTFYVSLAMRL